MKKFLITGTLSLVTAALLTGCGSSSNDTDNTGDTSSLLTGYFIDSAVANCEYTTSSGKSGRTDNYGKFQYKAGDKVKFSLGGLNLGEASPAADGLITPASLTENEEDKVRLLRVLQALDTDGDPSNGITIDDSVITALEKIAAKNVSDINNDQELIDLNPTLAQHIDSDYDGDIDVSKEEATAHFDNSQEKWDGGHKPDDGMQDNQGNGQGNGQGQGQGNGGKSEGTDEHGFDVDTLPKSTLNQEIIESLAYMGNEERLAYDIYTTLYTYHNNNGTELKQLKNIPEKSEVKHVGIVQDLVRKYDINISTVQNVENPVATKDVAFEDMPTGKYDIVAIQNLYDELYAKGITSAQAALEVGCKVEVVDVEDLDKYIEIAQAADAQDIVQAYDILRKGSYNHYWAFDKALIKMGVSEGCAATVGYHDYPQNEKGGEGQGKGNN